MPEDIVASCMACGYETNVRKQAEQGESVFIECWLQAIGTLLLSPCLIPSKGRYTVAFFKR